MSFLLYLTGNIKEAETQWKKSFHEWNTKYIVDWKVQYDMYMAEQQACGNGGR